MLYLTMLNCFKNVMKYVIIIIRNNKITGGKLRSSHGTYKKSFWGKGLY
jgi:hypothetical protein